MEHCLSHHKLLALPSPLSTLKPRLALNFAPKSQALTRRLTVVAGAGASSHCEFSSLNSPLDPRTRSGKDLSSVLQNHPQLFHLAVAQELKQLADQRQDARCRMYLSASSHEACLHRRIAQLKEQQCQIAVEDVMYLLIFYKFSEVKVPLVPKLSRCIYNDRLEILPAKDWELESIYSLEVLEMIREHVTTVIGLRANSSVTDNWAMTKITRQTLGRVYVASILYGYFLKSVSLRHRLERSLFLETQDLHLSCRTSLQEMSPHGIKSLLFGHVGKFQSECVGSSRQEKTHGKLKCYVMGFDPETLQRCAKLRSEEAVNLIKNHCCALFGDDAEMGSLESDEVISTSFSSLKRLVLEAVAFGSFLWDTEECIDSVYKLKDN
ncbi:UV-B-induced protein At3g17800, chloroplastic [Rosa rugosa]|uniref:UV-B-induced protein At3g17800, chloroplastic n=1 Tax=Rosa rugosa TaxID=74645 RepID=UPI002B40248A|nr:UV-B-induced protein At3g17800, chloroplastic [Rosa rugosa]